MTKKYMRVAVIFTLQASYDRKEVIANNSEQKTVASEIFCKFKVSYRFNSLKVGGFQLLLALYALL